jgi:hypothetical protein
VDILSKIAIVSGHLTAFFDYKIVDGFVNLLADMLKSIGSVLWDHSKKSPQYLAWFIILIVSLVLYFSL